jgi:RHS repeat-associated protein
VSASFAYDAVGRRRSRTVGSTTTQFLYDGLNPVQELASGTPTANLLTGLGIDEYFTRTDGAGSRNLLTDALGSTIALANGSGTVQTEYTYDPFGSVTTSGSASANTFGFTARENDGTGLNYYRARYYDSFLQRFLSEDPAGSAGGDANLHAYVRNSPTNLVDPTGEIAVIALPAAGCIGGALGAIIGNGIAGRKPSLREIGAGCAAGSIIGLAGWAVAPSASGAAAAAGAAGGAAGAAKIASDAGTAAPAPLKFLHDAGSLSRSSLDFWGRQSTDRIVNSLRPGLQEGLRVKPDGLIMNGNTRIRVLLDRGFPINTLPREIYISRGGG